MLSSLSWLAMRIRPQLRLALVISQTSVAISRRCLVHWTAGGFLIFDLVQPAVERGSGDAEIAGDLSPGDLEGLHVPEDEEPLADIVSRLLILLMEVFLQDRDLHFELVDPVFEEDDFLGFGVSIPGCQSFEVSLAHASRESGREQGGSDEQ